MYPNHPATAECPNREVALPDLLVAAVIDAVVQRDVDRAVLARALPHLGDVPRLREEVPVVLVERYLF